jgi:UDP-N-acetylmuramoylalanine--D-glutamate ligase
MQITEFNNKRILLAGYGVEGKATEHFLRTHAREVEIDIADENQNTELFDRQEKYDMVIKSPGISKRKLKTKHYTTATNIFFRYIKNPTIGITGTKGKSTTASLIAHALNANGKTVHLLGNIGQPLLTIFSEKVDPDDIMVCELSSYQLDDIIYSPDISVVINLFPDHLPYHGSLNNYYHAKKNIIAYPGMRSFYIYNKHFPLLAEWAEEFPGKTIPYPDDTPIDMTDYALKGEHNKENIHAVLAVTRLYGLDDKSVLSSCKTFQPLPHRLQYVGTSRGILFYDDAISTTPESTIEALKTLPSVKTLLLGGEDRGYDFSQLVEVIKEKKIPNVVLFPDSGNHILREFEKQQYIPNAVLMTDSMDEAVQFAYKHTNPSQVCLLSTASPSYTVWKNYIEKGELYQDYIRKYENS